MFSERQGKLKKKACLRVIEKLGGTDMYDLQIRVETLKISEWLDNYCCPEKFLPLCKDCPDYQKNWSCPTGVPDVRILVKEYAYVQVIGLKVVYDPWVRKEALDNPEREEELRQQSYGSEKKKLLQVLLALEETIPNSLSIMAGKCELCDRCARLDGKPCRHPKQMRYSFSGLGFDLGRIADEILEMPLLWQNNGLPEYNVAIAAFLHS